MVRRATCCCGDGWIEVEGDPEINGLCHCADCQRRTGSAFGWSAYFRDINILRTSVDLINYQVRKEQQRWFCGTCGSCLFWKSESFPQLTGIAAGCFADPAFPPPTVTLTDERRCAWVGLPEAWGKSL